MLIIAETEMSFWELKQPIVQWLTRHGMYILLHIFGEKDVDTTALGYLKGISMVDTFQLDLQNTINNKLATIINMNGDEQAFFSNIWTTKHSTSYHFH